MKKFWTVLIFCFRYRSVIFALDTLPSVPADWHDSELVKRFVLLCIDSPFAVKLVQTTETDWDDKRLADVRSLLLNTAVWETALHFFEDRFGTITVPFLERIKNILHFQLAENGSQYGNQCGDASAENVIEVLSLISLLYQLRAFFHKQ